MTVPDTVIAVREMPHRSVPLQCEWRRSLVRIIEGIHFSQASPHVTPWRGASGTITGLEVFNVGSFWTFQRNSLLDLAVQVLYIVFLPSRHSRSSWSHLQTRLSFCLGD